MLMTAMPSDDFASLLIEGYFSGSSALTMVSIGIGYLITGRDAKMSALQCENQNQVNKAFNFYVCVTLLVRLITFC